MANQSNTTPHPQFEQFKLLAETQLGVNNTMAGENWLQEAVAAERIDYSWAALDEGAELWRCAIPFKFWDKTEFKMDGENAKMEVIDLLHFALAQDLATAFSEGVTDSVKMVSKVADRMCQGQASSDDFEDAQKALRSSLKGFIHGLTHPKGCQIRWRDLFTMAAAVGLTATTMVSLYTAKSVLNKFRTQMRANGKYNKVWLDEKEDNYYLTQWLSAQAVQPPEADIMNWLISTHRRMLPQ